MTNYYGNPELSQTAPEVVSVGDDCCAPFDYNDSWYRANVIEVNQEEEEATLFYIDYGDTGLVSFEDLREPK